MCVFFFKGTSHREETLRQTQNSLKGLYDLSGLGTPWDPQDLECATGGKEVRFSFLNLLPLLPDHRGVAENPCMDVLACEAIRTDAVINALTYLAKN